MSTPNNTDLLLVERGGSQYKLPYSDLNNKLDTDVFLVERGGVQYKVLGEFIGGSGVGVVTAAPVLSDDNDSKAPAVITVTDATVENATLTGTVVLKDGVAIAVATGSSFSATDPGVYTVKQTWTDGLGNIFQVEAQLELLGLAVYVDELFSTTLYKSNASSTGDGTEQVITTGIDHTEGFLTWIKNRDIATDHVLFDSERVGSVYEWIYSNDNHGEQDTADIFKNPTSTGFTVKMDTVGSGVGRTNPAGSQEMCAWTFRKAPGFVDVVTWTGDSGSSRQISHSLGSAPGMIMIKRLNGYTDWAVYHRSIGAGKFLCLNSNVGEEASTDVFGNTEPTSTHFTVGNHGRTNANNDTYIAYIFAHDAQSFGTNSDESIIKCGATSSISNNSTTTVDLGFEPQFILLKSIDVEERWLLLDTMRGLHSNINAQQLRADSGAAETSAFNSAKITSTGFSVENFTGGTTQFLYMAIRRPHKPVTAGTEVFTASYANGGTYPSFNSNNHTIDFGIYRRPNVTEDWYTTSRLTGNKYLHTNEPDTESGSAINYDYQYGFTDSASSDYFAYMFRRAPGFLDVVTYEGTGSARTIPHNLNATPSVVLIKSRDTGFNWYWQHYALGADTTMQLNNGESKGTHGQVFNSTLPTSSVFSVGELGATNNNGDNYIAYLFGDLDGISKAGVYTGTGNEIDVDCGFTTGARFVMIKRVDGTPGTPDQGDWYVWDTTRGINGSSEPFLKLNTDDPQVTTTDYIDPLISGFKVTASGQADTNAAGGEYLFLAIA